MDEQQWPSVFHDPASGQWVRDDSAVRRIFERIEGQVDALAEAILESSSPTDQRRIVQGVLADVENLRVQLASLDRQKSAQKGGA